jgi:uncharacterized protein YcbK (DUF882 family)
MLARRDLLKFGAASMAAGVAALPGKGWSQDLIGDYLAGARNFLPDTGPRKVAFHNLHTDEKLEAVYFENGAYQSDALAAIGRVLRDYRTGDIHEMEPGLMDLLHSLSAKVETVRPYQIISGYRSPRTNAMLHERSAGVAVNSFHMKGMAIDVRLDDVELPKLHRAALEMGRGGVGYYPESDFVHVDIGPVRRWG